MARVMVDVNVWAVLVAALTSFLLGGLWYSPMLFGKVWNREAGRPEKAQGGGHPALVFGTSYLLSVVAAFALAVALGPAPELGLAVRGGVLAGTCFVAASFGINYAFASRGWKLWLVDGGYHAVQFGLFGLVLGLWH